MFHQVANREELSTVWSAKDVFEANQMLDAWLEAQHEASKPKPQAKD